MKTIICLLLLILIPSPITIKLDYYEGEGVIFPKEYRNYNLGSPMPTYTPTINQVIRAEKIMHENYHIYKIMIYDSLKLTGKHDLKNSKPKLLSNILDIIIGNIQVILMKVKIA